MSQAFSDLNQQITDAVKMNNKIVYCDGVFIQFMPQCVPCLCSAANYTIKDMVDNLSGETDNGHSERFTLQAAGADKIGSSLTLADLEGQASNAVGEVNLLPIELDEPGESNRPNDASKAPHSTLKVSPEFALKQMSIGDQQKFILGYMTDINGIAENIDDAIENTGFFQYIRGRAGYNIDQSERYIYLRDLGLVDLQHVVSAAHNFLSRFTIGHAPGVLVELEQVLGGSQSGWLHEDFLSNRLGAISHYGPEGTTIGSRVQQIIIDNHPVISRDEAIVLYYNNRDAER